MALALSLLPLRLLWALAECCARVGTDAGLSIEFCLNWGAGASPGVSGDKGLGLGFGASAGVVVRPADSAGADIDAIDAAVDVECTVAAPALADADAEDTRSARACAERGGGRERDRRVIRFLILLRRNPFHTIDDHPLHHVTYHGTTHTPL